MAGRKHRARGTRRIAARLAPGCGERGLTLIELIVAFSLLLILSVMALPVARVKVQREKERRLRHSLEEIRQAIDRHKDLAESGGLGGLDPDNFGYPETLEALVDGVKVTERPPSLPYGAQGSGSESGQSFFGAGQGPGQGSSFGTNAPRGGGFGFDRQAGARGSFGATDPDDRDREPVESVRFLREIPVDPMTGRRTWGLLSVSDDPDSRSWNGRNVFDVYSLSAGIALDGTRYGEW